MEEIVKQANIISNMMTVLRILQEGCLSNLPVAQNGETRAGSYCDLLWMMMLTCQGQAPVPLQELMIASIPTVGGLGANMEVVVEGAEDRAAIHPLAIGGER